MKGFLSREGYTFTDRNVEEDDAAYDELISLGVRTVPLTVIDGRSVQGFDEDELRAALAGEPPAGPRRQKIRR